MQFACQVRKNHSGVGSHTEKNVCENWEWGAKDWRLGQVMSSRQLHQAQAVGPSLASLQVVPPCPLPVGQPLIRIRKAMLPNYRSNPAGEWKAARAGMVKRESDRSALKASTLEALYEHPLLLFKTQSLASLPCPAPAHPHARLCMGRLTAGHLAAPAQPAVHTRCEP